MLSPRKDSPEKKKMAATGIIVYRPSIGKTITDLLSGIKYVLQKVIGISGDDFIYKAAYYTADYATKGSLLPSGYVTVKYIRPGIDVIRSRTQQSAPNQHTIIVDTWYIRGFRDGFLVSLPYFSEGSLRYMLSSRFHYGLPEDCIAIALKQALLSLNDIHNSGQVHKTFTTADIFVNSQSLPVSNVEIKLAFALSVYESDPEYAKTDDDAPNTGQSSVPPLFWMSEWAGAPEVYYKKYCISDSDEDEEGNLARNERESYETFKSDIWLVGIAALELAYGNIRVTSRTEFETMIKKIRKSKKLPGKLEYVLDEIYEKQISGKMKKFMGFFKKKLKKLGKKKRDHQRVFSKEFEEVVLECLSKKPSKRPTVEKLLQKPFFQNAKDLKYFQRRVLYAKNPMPDSDDDDD